MNTDPRDETLGALYRKAAIEMPRAEADATVLRMARQAVAPAPSGAARWGPRMALAATVVLAVGLVTRIQLEAPDLHPPAAPASTVPPVSADAAASVPAPAPKTGTGPAGTVDSPPPAVVARESRQMRSNEDIAPPAQPALSKLRERAGTPENQAAGAAAAKIQVRPLEKAESASVQTGANNPVGAVADSVARSENRPRGENEFKKDREAATDQRMPPAAATPSTESVQAGSSGPAAAPFPAASGSMPAIPATPPPAAKPAPAMPALQSVPAARSPASSPDAERRSVIDELPEAMLTAEQWAARIAALRKSGRHAEANASLKRLTERFPGFKVPAEARSPDIE